MSFGFMINTLENKVESVDYLQFLKSNHSAVFTDGISSGIKLDTQGRVVKYFSVMEHTEDDMRTTWSPYEHHTIAQMCSSPWIGVIMQNNGDLLIFKDKRLFFVMRNGKWMYLNSLNVIDIIKESGIGNNDEKKKFADAIYLSILDTSFAHTGACLAIIKNDVTEDVKNTCFPKDTLENNDNDKKKIINSLIDGQYFQNLDRKLRLELLSLDGATVLDANGKVLCAGAIVKIDGGSEGGGRLAATKALARYGMAIKISMDGGIQGYRANASSAEPDDVFKFL